MFVRTAAFPAALLALALVSSAAELRKVNGNTLVSDADPAASFVVNASLPYAGGQAIDILKVAGAEQHFFVDAAPDRSIRRFCLVQFEHYYPDNAHTYDFSSMKQTPVALGRLTFMGDVRVKPDYFTMDKRPGSDSMAMVDFLRGKGFKVDGTFVSLRLFHLPDDSKRREVMVIYGEVLPAGASEDEAKTAITAHAQANVAVR